MEQEIGKERYTPMGQEAESETYQVDMEKIYRQLDAEDKVIEYLAGEIAKERKKPGFLQDQARIDKCLDTIAKLKNHKTEYSQEELKAKAEALLAKARAKEAAETAAAPARRYRLRPVLVAVILLVVVCICGATACGVIPSLRMWFAKIVNNPGATVDDNGITYSYNGQAVIYKDINELLEKEQLDILYPSKLPEGVELKNVQRKMFNGQEKIFLVCNITDVNFAITIDFDDPFQPNSVYEKCVINDINVFYRKETEKNRYVALFLHDNNYYSITASDYESVFLILNNLKGI